MAIAPVGVGVGLREVEQARLGQRRQHLAEGLEVPLVAIRLAGAGILEQPPLRRQFVEQRLRTEISGYSHTQTRKSSALSCSITDRGSG